MIVERLDLADGAVAAQVLRVQHAAYQVEAGLIGFDAIPQLHEEIEDVVAVPLQWRGIRVDGQVVAVIGYTEDAATVDIDRLVVAPEWMRRGYASALLASLDPGATITVSTGTDNSPAHRLYLRHGFVASGESEPIPGLSITHFERREQ